MDLAQEKCVACNSATEKMSPDQAREMLAQIPGWDLFDDKIERTLTFADFVGAMRFANRITLLAEEENHHPDLHISYGKMRIALSTHKVGGLSRNDFILAARINKLVEDKLEQQGI